VRWRSVHQKTHRLTQSQHSRPEPGRAFAPFARFSFWRSINADLLPRNMFKTSLSLAMISWNTVRFRSPGKEVAFWQ